MKKIILSIILFSYSTIALSADLIEVYKQAYGSDPLFQQAISQRLATKQGVPIAVGSLLPNISFGFTPAVTGTTFGGSNIKGVVSPSGAITLSPPTNTQRAYNMTLTVNQTIFNFAQFATVANALAISKQADAVLNAALQALMVRTSTAYLEVLKDEESLSYAEASKIAFAEQLDQVKQQYQVGLKTVTEVYTAEASYASAVANVIAAQTKLSNDKENLRVITGRYYPSLYSLSEDFPLATPDPQNVEKWVSIALQQNWTIKAGQYAVDAAREIVKQQFAGHLPVLSLQGTANKIYTNNLNEFRSFEDTRGAGTQVDRTLSLNLTVPIFSGGTVVAQTRQAGYQLENTQQQLEQTVRETSNTTRQSYQNIISGISQITADRQAVRSNVSSLAGMEASYQVGTTTLVDVLNQQQKLFEAQMRYATDRYAYVESLLLLKQAAGTLSFEDLVTLNRWLVDKPANTINPRLIKKVVLGQVPPPPPPKKSKAKLPDSKIR